MAGVVPGVGYGGPPTFKVVDGPMNDPLRIKGKSTVNSKYAIGQGYTLQDPRTGKVYGPGQYQAYCRLVICTEMYRRGDTSDEIWEADVRFGSKQTINVMVGYHLWAEPLVRGMQKHDWLYKIVRPMAKRWSNHMAYKERVLDHNDYFGAIMHTLGAPLCALLGMIFRAIKGDAAAQKFYTLA